MTANETTANETTASNTAAFEAKVTAQGYQLFHRTLSAADGLGEHVHDFDVWGLVLTGEFIITCDGEATSYGPGQEFQLTAGCPHEEAAGPNGVTFVVGRRTS